MRLVLLLIAAVIAIVAGIVALQWSGKNTGPVPQVVATGAPASQDQPVQTVDIYVAREPIAMGTVITDKMIDRQPWPRHLVLENFIIAEGPDSNPEGKVARSNFQAREPLMNSKLANPNDPSFLAAALPQGYRAITVATDAISGVAGYVFPGDRVDVVLTHNVPREIKAQNEPVATSSQKPAITEVMIPNVRVLAVNVREPAGKESTTISPSSVTLEVKDEDVQRIRLAEKVGSLSLSLRSIADRDSTEEPDPSVLPSLTQAAIDEMQRSAAAVRVIRGAGAASDVAPASGPIAIEQTTTVETSPEP